MTLNLSFLVSYFCLQWFHLKSTGHNLVFLWVALLKPPSSRKTLWFVIQHHAKQNSLKIIFFSKLVIFLRWVFLFFVWYSCVLIELPRPFVSFFPFQKNWIFWSRPWWWSESQHSQIETKKLSIFQLASNSTLRRRSSGVPSFWRFYSGSSFTSSMILMSLEVENEVWTSLVQRMNVSTLQHFNYKNTNGSRSTLR